MNDERWVPRLAFLLTIVALVWLAQQIVPLLQMFGDILLLFFLAWLIAFALDPLVGVLEHRMRRSIAVALLYAVLLFGLGLIVLMAGPLAIEQLGRVTDALAGLVSQLPTQQDVTHILSSLGLPVNALSAVYQPETLAQRLQAAAGLLVQGVLAVATGALTVVVNLLLILIISFYMLLDGRRMVWNALRVMPRERRSEAMLLLTQLSVSFGGFLRGQVIQAVLFGAVVVVLMIIARLDFVVVVAMTSALFMLMPIIGPILALIPPLAMAYTQPATVVVVLLVILVVVQFGIINLLMPRILGRQMGMSPLLVFLAILIGLRIGGPLGAFFGIPIMGVIFGMVSVFFSRWKSAEEVKPRQTLSDSAD